MSTRSETIPDPQALARVLETIGDLNAELLEALIDSARMDPEHFPLPHCLRVRFSRLRIAHSRERGRCGVSLADAGFSDGIRWGRVAAGENLNGISPDDGPWLFGELGIVLAQSVLMVAWHVARALPSLGTVLLGMSDEVTTEFRKLNISDLARIAQCRSGWVRPRWAGRADVWKSIIATGEPGHEQEPMTVLRCLKASATESRRLMSSTEAGLSREL